MIYETNSLSHYGIKGQKWGLRRFQNQDGTYTAEGKARYRKDESRPQSVNPKERFKKQQKPNMFEKLRDSSMKAAGGIKTGGVYDRDDGTKDVNRLKKDAKKDAEDMARAKAYYGEGAGNRRKQIRNRISERMKDPDYKAEYEKQLAAQDMSKHQKAANRERHAQDAKNTIAKTGRGIKNLILGVGSASMAAVAIYNAAKLTGADKKIAEFGKKAVSDIINKARSMKKPSVKDYDWHSSNSSRQASNSTYKNSTPNQTRRDIQERMDRAKYGTQRPWIDEDGNIHYK